MFDVALIVIVAFFTIMIPGTLLALALLRKTGLSLFEILIFGFVFGFIETPMLTWFDSYFMNSIHFFSFSLSLYLINALILTIVGIVLCLWRGAFKGLWGDIVSSGPLKLLFTGGETGIIARERAEFKGKLEEVRHELSRLNAGMDIINSHRKEEEDLKKRHESELAAAKGLSTEDLDRISRQHSIDEQKLMEAHEREERGILNSAMSTHHNEPKPAHTRTTGMRNVHWAVWAILLLLMLSVFANRMQSISVAPSFFEFDPYFDMIDAKYILTYGQQLLLDPSAWPATVGGTNHRIEPLVPYVEAYWYSLSESLGPNASQLDNSLMSYVGGVYPPIAAALLVFVVFILIYYEYNEYVALIGASLTALMPLLVSTFIAGEQLVEPWGIFALFFFIAAYMLSMRNPKKYEFAILAGIAFVSNFFGAHYYSVTTGVFVLYIMIQGIINFLRQESNHDFLKANLIIIVVIAVFYAIFWPYGSNLQNRIPSIAGIPITLSGPAVAFLFILLLDYIPKFLNKKKILFKGLSRKTNLLWLALIAVLGVVMVLFTPLNSPIMKYYGLSIKFTTPSIPLFMTVQEYEPTGPLFNFDANGFGPIGAQMFGLPLMVWLVVAISFALIMISIVFRNSKTGVMYLAISIPLLFAGFSEVKYLPHLGVAYILLFCIMLGELIYWVEHDFKFKLADHSEKEVIPAFALIIFLVLLLIFALAYSSFIALILILFLVSLLGLFKSVGNTDALGSTGKKKHVSAMLLSIGIFFISSVLGVLYLLYSVLTQKYENQQAKTYVWGMLIFFILIMVVSLFDGKGFFTGEVNTYVGSLGGAVAAAGNTSNAQLCNTIANQNNAMAYSLYCNTIPAYWLNAMSWIRQNVGPNAPRVLAWWDYGDWINWFGNSNAYLRGDNANASEDYATAAQYVLGTKDGYTPATLANMMNGNQTKYVLFDQDLIGKWGALDFLGCIHANLTTMAFATAQGQAQQPPQPFQLGTSQCELSHDPEYALVPLATLVPSNSSQQSVNFYCSISTQNATYAQAYVLNGSSIENQSVCVNLNPSSTGALSIYSTNGIKLNAVIQASQYQGAQNIQGVTFIQFPIIYLPNGPNGTITDAPNAYYTSNYYRAFFLGNLPGFTEVYPQNATGINFVNGTYPVRIFELNNFTGTLPEVPPKPSWINNNYTMP
ncbi:MAG: hypothetical protein M1504_03525 [Candidatus Marsarchaeota archaeon]|nr:hypothetical protein [Candidatus Marsarchaeota archaeon]